jgi:hypothetical protein
MFYASSKMPSYIFKTAYEGQGDRVICPTGKDLEFFVYPDV